MDLVFWFVWVQRGHIWGGGRRGGWSEEEWLGCVLNRKVKGKQCVCEPDRIVFLLINCVNILYF